MLPKAVLKALSFWTYLGCLNYFHGLSSIMVIIAYNISYVELDYSGIYSGFMLRKRLAELLKTQRLK